MKYEWQEYLNCEPWEVNPITLYPGGRGLAAKNRAKDKKRRAKKLLNSN